MDKYQEIQHLLFSLLFEMKSGLAKAIRGNRFELAPMHLKALTYFCHYPNSTQQDMADKTGRDKAYITRLLKELEQKGFIHKERDEDDKRSFRIQVTRQGKIAFRELKKHEDTISRKVLTGFSDNELKQLKESLSKMHNNLG